LKQPEAYRAHCDRLALRPVAEAAPERLYGFHHPAAHGYAALAVEKADTEPDRSAEKP
jgi:hypothetical protein